MQIHSTIAAATFLKNRRLRSTRSVHMDLGQIWIDHACARAKKLWQRKLKAASILFFTPRKVEGKKQKVGREQRNIQSSPPTMSRDGTDHVWDGTGWIRRSRRRRRPSSSSTARMFQPLLDRPKLTRRRIHNKFRPKFQLNAKAFNNSEVVLMW